MNNIIEQNNGEIEIDIEIEKITLPYTTKRNSQQSIPATLYHHGTQIN